MIKNLIIPSSASSLQKFCVVLMLLLCPFMAEAQHSQRIFMSFDASNGLADNSAQTLKCTKEGRIVCSTIGHINFFDGSVFTHIDPLKEDAYPLEKYHGHYHIYYDRYHHLWLKDKHQVTCLNLWTEHFEHDVAKVFRELHVPQPVDDLFTDSDSCLWTQTGNVLMCLERNLEIHVKKDLELHDLDVMNGEVLLFYNNGSVSIYDAQNGKQKNELKGSLAPGKHFRSSVILADDNTFLQICNSEKNSELRRLDIKTHRWTTLMQTPYHLNNMVVHENCIYVPCEYGYWVYDKQKGTAEHIETLVLTKGRTLNTDVNAVCFDHQGGMWMGTEKRGLLYARPINPPFHVYPWSDPKAIDYVLKLEAKLGEIPTYRRPVICVYKDSRGWTWTGTYTGLQLEQGNKDSVRTFKRADGIINEMIHSVVEDENHDIWAGTSFGISHLFVKDNNVYRVETYYNRDDVPNESFVNGKAVMFEDSTIVFQSLDHIVAFKTRDFHNYTREQRSMLPRLVSLRVNGHQIEANEPLDDQVIIDKAPMHAHDIYVNYDQTTIEMLFSGLNYFRPVQTYYRVRVKGTQRFDQWKVLSYSNSNGVIDRNGLFHLLLMDLDPGEWTVELQAALVPDVWENAPEVWTIHVNQPWWRTTGLYITLGVLLLLLLLFNVYLYNHNMRLRLQRHNEDVNLLKRIRVFARRCYTMKQQGVTEKGRVSVFGEQKMSQEYVDVMLKVVPYVLRMGSKRISINELAEVADIDTITFYQLLEKDMDKSPSLLIDQLDLSELDGLISH